MNKKYVVWVGIMGTFGVLFVAAPSFAVSYGTDKMGSALGNTIDWVTTGLGSAMVVLGLIYTGIRMAMHDREAWITGAFVVGGGILIFLAPSILGLIQGWAR